MAKKMSPGKMMSQKATNNVVNKKSVPQGGAPVAGGGKSAGKVTTFAGGHEITGKGSPYLAGNGHGNIGKRSSTRSIGGAALG